MKSIEIKAKTVDEAVSKALSELNTEDVNIITVEDPVEANIDGINQVQVNNKATVLPVVQFSVCLGTIKKKEKKRKAALETSCL